MSRTHHPVYAEGVKLYLNGEVVKLARLLKSERLSANERRLLQARQILRKDGAKQATAVLKEFLPAQSQFLDAEVLFVRAQIEFSAGRFEAAAIANASALKTFEQLGDRRGKFLCHYNLGVDYSRLQLALLSRHHYDRAAELSATEGEFSLVERAICCELSRTGRHPEAADRMLALEPKWLKLGPGDLSAHLMVALDIYQRAEKFADAQRILLKLKRNKRGLERARLELDEALLKILSGQEVIVGRLKPLLQSHQEFGLQWKLVECLRAGALSEAQASWHSLALLAPRKYGQFLEPARTEDRGQIFFATLRSLRVNSVGIERSVEVAAAVYPTSRLKELFEILRASPTPLRKEEIIERVWGVAYDPGFDTRFYKLLERFRRSSRQYSVVCANRAYSLRAPQ